MRLLLTLFITSICLFGLDRQDIPNWVRHGILNVETGSFYDYSNGTEIIYVNRARGRAGERGPFQMTYICWKDIKKPGERFLGLQTNMTYAEECFERYILKMYKLSGNWDKAVQHYNRGPRKLSSSYLRDVKLSARKLGY